MLLDPARRLVVRGDVAASYLTQRIEDGSMPPEEEEEFPRLSSDEIEVLKKWVAGGAPGFDPAEPADRAELTAAPDSRAVAVKSIFEEKCADCHRLGSAKNGIKILNHDLLVFKRKVVVPGQPAQSSLFKALSQSGPEEDHAAAGVYADVDRGRDRHDRAVDLGGGAVLSAHAPGQEIAIGDQPMNQHPEPTRRDLLIAGIAVGAALVARAPGPRKQRPCCRRPRPKTSASIRSVSRSPTT